MPQPMRITLLKKIVESFKASNPSGQWLPECKDNFLRSEREIGRTNHSQSAILHQSRPDQLLIQGKTPGNRQSKLIFAQTVFSDQVIQTSQLSYKDTL